MTVPRTAPVPFGARTTAATTTTVSQAPAREQEVSRLAAYLVAAVIFVNLTRVASIYPIIAAAQVPLLLTIVAAIVMFSQAAKWRPGDLLKHWISWAIIVVILFAALGIPTAIHRGASFENLTQSYSQSILGGMMMFGVARTARGRRLMAQTLVISGIVTAWLAIVWGRRDHTGRLAGAATYDSNDLALIIVISLPLLIWWFFDNKSKLRWIAILALPMMFSVMLRTSSRGGFLGMVAIMAGLLFIGTTGRVREVRRIALTGILLAVLGALALPATYTQRMRTMDEELDNKSPRARINVWKRGVGYAFDHPVLGVGIGNFGRAEGILSDYSQERAGIGVKWSTAHSSYIQAWAEVGLIGGTAFVLAILGGTIALMLWRPTPDMTDVAVRMLTPMVGLSLGGFAVAGAFLSFAFESPPYYLLGLAVALLMVSGRKPGKEDSRMPARPGSPARLRGGALPVRPPPSRYPAPPIRVQLPPPGRS